MKLKKHQGMDSEGVVRTQRDLVPRINVHLEKWANEAWEQGSWTVLRLCYLFPSVKEKLKIKQ